MKNKRVTSFFLLTILFLVNFSQVIGATSYFTEDENVILNKTIKTISKDQCDEEYEINLEVNTKEVLQSLKQKIDVELLIDASGSLDPQGKSVKDILNHLAEGLIQNTDNNMGVTTFQGKNNITVLQKIKHMDNAQEIQKSINDIKLGGATPMLKGLYVAHTELQSGIRKNSDKKVLIIFGDGQPNVDLNGADIYSTGYTPENGVKETERDKENRHNADIINKANEIKAEGYEIITVFLETSDNKETNINAVDLFQKIASDNQAYYAEDIGKLLDIFKAIIESFKVNSYDVVKNVAKEFVVVPESIKSTSKNVDIDVQGSIINWKVKKAEESNINFIYRVRRNKETPEGTYNVAKESYVKYIDKNNQEQRIDFPPVEITLEGSCSLGQIIIKYVDEKGRELAPKTFTDNLELKKYMVKAKEIPNYKVKGNVTEELVVDLSKRNVEYAFVYSPERLPQTGEKNMLPYYVFAVGIFVIGIFARKSR